jgi:hypothetical protein
MTITQKIIAAAEAELGVTEHPPGSNRGARVEFFQSLDWLAGGGYPWCVDFAWDYVIWYAVLKLPNPYPTAAVEQLETWAGEHEWDVPVASISPADLACLGHGRHVTIVHHLLPGGTRFAGIGGNQSDSVRISEYDRADISTLIRVPARFSPPPPAKRKPIYEVVRGEGEKARVVYTSRSLDKAAGKVTELIRRGATGARILKRPGNP